MCILLTLFQKIDGPGPPLGNSVNGRIRNYRLTLGVEALCLHAESAEGGPGTVPVHVFIQQTTAALSCQPSVSITVALKSLQCIFTYQSMGCKEPVQNQRIVESWNGLGSKTCTDRGVQCVNVSCSWGGGQYPLRTLQEQGRSFAPSTWHSSGSKTVTQFGGNAFSPGI